jgi:dienelactone hydrolase
MLRTRHRSRLDWLRGALLACGVVTAAGAPASADDPPVLPLARTLARQLGDGDLAAIHKQFSPAAQQGLSLAQFEAVWRSVLDRYGAMQHVGEPTLPVPSDPATAVVPLTFKNGTLGLKIRVVGGSVAAFQLLPGAPPQGDQWEPPPYANGASFQDIDLEFGRSDTRLPATLSLPRDKAPFAAVVLVHGSGPSDRDGSLGPNKPLKDFAQGLATRGIAVLRYEKRSRLYPDAFRGKAFTVHEEVLEDAALAVAYLATHPDIAPGRIHVLGHSLGAMLAPRIATMAPQVAGLILAAGATRPLPLVMRAQVEYLSRQNAQGASASRPPADLLDDIEKALVAQPSTDATPLLGATLSYWADLNAYDPAKAAAAYRGRILVLQGARDYQVTLEDTARFSSELAGRADVRIKIYDNLNHLFMSGRGPSLPAEYMTKGHVAPEVIADVAAFVLGQ